MNHARTAIAISALALSAAALGATQASAQYEPGPGSAPATVPPAPAPDTDLAKTSVDDTVSEGLQVGASALGGAGVALGAVWIYRRRQALNG